MGEGAEAGGDLEVEGVGIGMGESIGLQWGSICPRSIAKEGFSSLGIVCRHICGHGIGLGRFEASQRGEGGGNSMMIMVRGGQCSRGYRPHSWWTCRSAICPHRSMALCSCFGIWHGAADF